MNLQNYHCSIVVPATAHTAFEKISRVGGWWAVNFNGSAEAIQDSFTVHFARTTWSKIEIVEMVPDQFILWKVVDCYLPIFNDPYLWKNNFIAWDIAPEEATTRITMTHIGLIPGLECYEDCSKGWGFYVGESLFKFVTEGKGLPGKGIFADVCIAGRKYEGLLFSKTEPFPDPADKCLILDIHERRGEQVLSAYSVVLLQNNNMSPQQLKGDYYMVLEDRPLSKDVPPLVDLQQIIVK